MIYVRTGFVTGLVKHCKNAKIEQADFKNSFNWYKIVEI
jgi:hypothetical protein